LFFSENWESKSSLISYGHDIEAAWLLYEAAVVLGDKKIVDNVRAISKKMADAVLSGFSDDGSLLYEKDGERIDADRHWWVQAEAVVGYMYLYKMTNDDRYMHKSQDAWRYIREQIIDSKSGEWIWSRKSDGTVNTKEDKAGFWKCPYHNGRMCMEMMTV
jgi:mannobiose 2-epimerase